MFRTSFARGAALLAPVLLVAPPALAAGGAHVIDDSVVETPGGCHLETWVTRYGPGHGLVNLSPACTRTAWPDLEIGGAAQHTWSASADDITLGPALKLTLRPESTGLGLGMIGGANWSVRSGRLETASLIAPATFKVGERVRINLNAGWSYSRASPDRHALFYGGQAEVGLARDVTLMAEAFQRDHGKAGGQIGLRWNPRRRAVRLRPTGRRTRRWIQPTRHHAWGHGAALKARPAGAARSMSEPQFRPLNVRCVRSRGGAPPFRPASQLH